MIKHLKQNFQKFFQSRKIFTALLILVMIVTALLLTAQILRFRHEGFFTIQNTMWAGHHSRRSYFLTHPASVDQIQPWMTFEYINKVFSLPQSDLQMKLAITDQAYPHLSIGRYAKHTRQSKEVVLEKVRQAITEFKTSAP